MICPVFAVGSLSYDSHRRVVQSGEVKPVRLLDGMIQEATAIHAAHPNY